MYNVWIIICMITSLTLRPSVFGLGLLSSYRCFLDELTWYLYRNEDSIFFNHNVYQFFFQLVQSSAEADTFFCFVELISGFRDNFCQQLDNSVVGIRSTITKLSQLLKEHDEELWRHLEVTTKVRNTRPHSLQF